MALGLVEGHPTTGVRRSVRPITGLAGLPSARAVVGGALVALAGLGAFVTWQRATAPSTQTYLVAAAPIAAGTELTASHLATVVGDLPAGPRDHLLVDPDVVIGRTTRTDLAAGALLGSDDLVAADGAVERHEVALRLSPEAALGGGLEVADHVLVLTTDERCTTVLAEATVTAVRADQSLSGGSVIATVQLPGADEVLAVTHAARTAEVTLAASSDATATSFCTA